MHERAPFSGLGAPREVVARPRGPAAWLWAVALLLLVGAGIVLALSWDAMPQRYPVHWNAQGEPDGWADRSVWQAAWPLLFGAANCGLFALLAWGLARLELGEKRSAGRRSIEGRLLREVLGAAALGVALLFAFIALQPLSSRPETLPRGLGWGCALGVVVLLAFIFWRSRVAGRRLDAIEPPRPEEREHWLWGSLVYANRDDPRLLVPKRLGVGWTLNVARPGSWLVLAALLLPGLLIVVVLFTVL